MRKARGFTIIELLIVIVIIGMMLSVTVPVSYKMYDMYRTAARAQDVMTYVSEIRREAFLYSERIVISSREGRIITAEHEKAFDGLYISSPKPIVFFRNGTSSGGFLVMKGGDAVQRLLVQAPLGTMSLESGGM